MRRSVVSWIGCLGCVGAVAISACNTASEDPLVTYTSAPAAANWRGDYGGGSAGAAGISEQPAAGSTAVLPNAGSSSGDILRPKAGAAAPSPAGSSGAAARGGSGGAGGSTGGAGGSTGGAGAGGAAGSGGSAAPGVTTLSFDVTTSPVGYRYQPKNIGAIWVQDKNGKLVKSLEVWAGIRRRWLTRYQSQLAGASVDVVASATLSNHRAHHVTWNLKDKSGAAAPPGQYTLMMELTDGDQTGRANSIPFDTSAGASTQTPANAPSFGSMTLKLE
jgi:hypothetical protein